MARPKKANPIKDAFQARIDAVTKDTAEDLYVELNESTELTPAVKEELNIALQVKMQTYEQAEHDATRKPLDPVKVETPSDEQSKEKPKGSIPSRVQAVSATEEQVMKYQASGKLFGHDPVKGIAFIIPILLLCFLFAVPAFAVTSGTMGDRESDGDYQWEVQDGNLIPGTTATYDIGSASKYVGTIYTSNLVATQYSAPAIVGTTSVTSPLIVGSTSVTSPLHTGANVVATASVTAPMFKINATASASRPASGATAGSIIAINNSNGASNCGTTADGGSAGSVYVVCISNGTNWVVL